MSIDKKKPDTSPADGVNTAADEAPDLDAVMRKYDRESATRLWEGTPQLIIRILMAAFGLFCIGMTLFSKAMPEIRLTMFVGCIIIIGFLTYPASKHHVRVNYLPWYDIVLMVVGAAVLEAAAVVLSMVKGAKKVVDLLTGLCQIAAPALLALAFINLVSARVEGFAFIYFSNADVLLEVQTAANMSSATCAIVNLVLLAVSSIAGVVSAFFTLKK